MLPHKVRGNLRAKEEYSDTCVACGSGLARWLRGDAGDEASAAAPSESQPPTKCSSSTAGEEFRLECKLQQIATGNDNVDTRCRLFSRERAIDKK